MLTLEFSVDDKALQEKLDAPFGDDESVSVGVGHILTAIAEQVRDGFISGKVADSSGRPISYWKLERRE